MMVVPCSGGKTGRLKKQTANSEFFLWELVQQFVSSVSVLVVTHPFMKPVKILISYTRSC